MSLRIEYHELVDTDLEHDLSYKTTHALQMVNTAGHPENTMVFATDSTPGDRIMGFVCGSAATRRSPSMQARAQVARQRRRDEAHGVMPLPGLDDIEPVARSRAAAYGHVAPSEPPISRRTLVSVARFHQRDGVTVAFDAAGSGEPPMVFVHGWLCDRSHFAPQMDHFAARHAVIGLDLPGHGDSGRPDPDTGRYSVDAFAEDVLAVALSAGCERPVVVGHSLGAAVALACASNSGAVRGVVMVDCTPILDPAAKQFLTSAVASIESDAGGDYRRQFFAGMFLPTDTVRRDEIIGAAGAVPAPIAAAAIRGLIAFDGATAFTAADVPVLWIRSGLPGDSPESVQAACPTVTIGQTVGAGHFIQLEVREQVNHMIERFLAVNDI